MNPTVAVPCAVMVHVPDQAAGFAWYRSAFPEAKLGRADEHDFEYLQVGEIRIEVVAADEKVRSGAAGSVIYWQVQDMDQRDTYHPEQDHGDAKAKHRTIPKRNSKAKRHDADEAWSDTKYDAPRPHDLKLGCEHR